MRSETAIQMFPRVPGGREIPAIARSGCLADMLSGEALGTRLAVARNQALFAEGDAARYCYLVRSGAVRICKLLSDGRRHIASFKFAGDFFGLDGPELRQHDAEAVTDVVVIRYPRAVIEQAAEEDPGLARRLRDHAFANLATAHDRMLCLGRKTALERVTSFLVEMDEQFGEADGGLEMPMSRGDIADYLGLTVETVSRVLSALRRTGAIALPNAHRIDILDHDHLTEIGTESAF
jgi:CRP-like cAMP-binding protein